MPADWDIDIIMRYCYCSYWYYYWDIDIPILIYYLFNFTMELIARFQLGCLKMCSMRRDIFLWEIQLREIVLQKHKVLSGFNNLSSTQNFLTYQFNCQGSATLFEKVYLYQEWALAVNLQNRHKEIKFIQLLQRCNVMLFLYTYCA